MARHHPVNASELPKRGVRRGQQVRHARPVRYRDCSRSGVALPNQLDTIAMPECVVPPAPSGPIDLHAVTRAFRQASSYRSRCHAAPRRRGGARRGRVGRAARLLCCLWLSLAGHSSVADDRLEAHSYGNISSPQFIVDYPALKALLVDGHVIPGLHRNFVPQGIDFLRSHPGEVVLSGYFCERFAKWRQRIRFCTKKRSALYLYDLDAREAVRLALLEHHDGNPMRLHVGGVAELHDRLWLPDNFVVYRFNLAELREAGESVIEMRPENEEPIGVDSSGDFITAFEDSLWIGNFQRGRRGHPLPGHYRSKVIGSTGWTAGYRIDPDTLRPTSKTRYKVSFGSVVYEVYRPDAALHHRSKVQGISFVGDQRVVLSSSYGPALSLLTFHALPGGPPLRDTTRGDEVTLPDGSPLWVRTLAIPTRLNLIKAPPGAEGVAYNGTIMAVAFEGGAMPYRQRWRRNEDRMLLFLPPTRVGR